VNEHKITMGKLHVKHGDESQFLYQTSVSSNTDEVISNIIQLYNYRLKIQRISHELEQLSQYGVVNPSADCNHGEYVRSFTPVNSQANPDPAGMRCGVSPSLQMQTVIHKTTSEATSIISPERVKSDIPLTVELCAEAVEIMRGAVSVTYAQGLPPHDPVRMEMENREVLSDEESKTVIDVALGSLWFSGKQIERGNKLKDYVGNNEKTKVVVKLQKQGKHAPPRENAMSSEQQQQWMLHAYRRQEEIKKLEECDDNSYLNSDWSDNKALKKSFHGLTNVTWR